jgi:hypothetical protein
LSTAAADSDSATVTGSVCRITVKKITNPVTAPADVSFAFTGDVAGSIGHNQTIAEDVIAPGSYNSTETVLAGWDLTDVTCVGDDNPDTDDNATAIFDVDLGESITCTFTNTQRGTVDLIKTFETLADTARFDRVVQFQIRQGASDDAITGQGTTLSEEFANGANGGNVEFATFATSDKDGILESPPEVKLLLVPGTYQICEYVQVGYDSSIRDMLEAFVPQGAGDPQTIDNSFVCAPFTIDPGENEVITIDNTPPPGGMAKTIGFWKNHASCKASKGKQDAVLDETLALFPIAQGQTTHGFYLGDLYVDTCAEAVALLNKSATDGSSGGRGRSTKRASDPVFNMTAQLVAAILNEKAGAGHSCIDPAIAEALRLLDKYNFNGITYSSVRRAARTASKNLTILPGCSTTTTTTT